MVDFVTFWVAKQTPWGYNLSMGAYDEYLKTAISAAEAGANVVRNGFREVQDITQKQDFRGLVTATDLASEQAIIEVLSTESPFGILSEESGELIREGDLRWVIDPLDGTSNFARGIPLFAVSIALSKGYQPLLGVIFEPLSGDCYTAQKTTAKEKGGSFLNGEPIAVSSTTDISRALLFVNHGYQAKARRLFASSVEALSGQSYLRKLGTTALELCHLAQGNADGFVCNGDEYWDFAAGLLLVEEAGGQVSDWNSRDWDGTNTFVLASNRSLHPELVDFLSKFQA